MIARNSSWQHRKESRSLLIQSSERRLFSPAEALRSMNFSATCLWNESSSTSMVVLGWWWWLESTWSRRKVSNDLPNDPWKSVAGMIFQYISKVRVVFSRKSGFFLERWWWLMKDGRRRDGVYKAIILTAYFNIYFTKYYSIIFLFALGLILFHYKKKYKHKGVTIKSYSLIFVCSHSFWIIFLFLLLVTEHQCTRIVVINPKFMLAILDL